MILCAVILGFTITASAQTDTKPKFKFNEEVHSFGKVPQGKPVTTDFTFTNIGEEPLILANVQPTCGCTIADYTKTPVLKNQQGSIKITYNAANIGAFSKTIVVTSNAETPNKNLIITGEVLAPTPASTTGTNK